jgi:hypothetical protein
MQEHWSFDIKDPERFVGNVVSRAGKDFDYHQRERLIQFLLIELWQFSLLEPRPWRNSFSGWVYPLLRLRVADFERQPEEGGRTKWKFGDGRVYERTRPQHLSLDELQLERPDTGEPVDVEVCSRADLEGVLGTRGSTGSRSTNGVGEASSREAA